MTVSRTPDGPILLLGSRGQLGSALASRLAVLGRVVCATRADADLEQAEELRALVRRVRPAVVVNAAAYTAVDKAETDAERCECVNAVAPGMVAEEAAAFDGAIVHAVVMGNGDPIRAARAALPAVAPALYAD